MILNGHYALFELNASFEAQMKICRIPQYTYNSIAYLLYGT